jgi:flagellar assembly protein FliH
MAAIIRAPRLSSEAVLLALPGSQELAAKTAKSVLHPIAAPVEAATPEAETTEATAGANEMAGLRAQLAAQEALAAQLQEELAENAQISNKKGYDEGYRSGLDEGRAAGKRELEREVAAFKQTGESLKKLNDEVLAYAENEMVGIVYEAVCKIVGEAVIAEEAARSAVRHFNQRREEMGVVGIRFSPGDYEALQRYFQTDPAAKPSGIEIGVDESIVLGGCTVETKTGMLQARMEDQLTQLKQVLLHARNAKG